MHWLLAVILAGSIPAAAQSSSGAPPVTLASLSETLRNAPLDEEACFRVRDFTFRRNELRLFFTDGVLIFRKPVQGVRTAAVFVASEDLEDAELLLIPPNRMERRSLAAFAGSPTLNEHFRSAAFLFTDGTGEKWLEELRDNPLAKRSPERGVLLKESWNPVVRNLSMSLEPRLLLDLLNGGGPGKGFFFGAIGGTTLGSFDVFIDPRSRDEFLVGQLDHADGQSRYNFWAHFEPRRPGQPARLPTPPPVKIERYEVDASVAPDLHFRAKVRLTLRASQDPVLVLPFDLSPRLRVTKATWNGQPVEVFQREALRANLLRSGDAQGLLLRPLNPLSSGETGVLEIEEEGDILFRSGNGVYYLATRVGWFPQMQFQPAPFLARFEHAKNLNIVCPGVRTEAQQGDHRLTTCNVAQPVRLFGFNLGEFASRTIKRGGVEVEVFANRTIETALARAPSTIMMPPPQVGRRRTELAPILTSPPPPPDPLARLGAMSDEIASAMEFFTAALGPPAITRVVAAPIPGSFGQGFPGFLYLSTLAYLEDSSLPADARAEWQGRYFRDILEAHEVAHQWWGNQVTFDNYRDEWLSEALANYSAILYLEKKRGPKAVDTVLAEYARRLQATDSDGNTLESQGPVVFGVRLRYANPRAWQAITYEKSTWILHMLRGRLGSAAFLKLLRQLVAEHSDHPLTTEDLRKKAAAYLPKGTADPELLTFFESWVYGTGIPSIGVTHTISGVAPKLKLAVTLKQSGVGDDFAIDVPIEVTLPRGQKIVRWLRTGPGTETFEIPVPAKPLRVSIEPHFGVLHK
jgi:hypothetical protein